MTMQAALAATARAAGAAMLLAAALTGCQRSGGLEVPRPRVPVTESRDGRIYAQGIETPLGDTIWVQVFEPAQLVSGRSYPLVLHGHGYGQARLRDAPEDSFVRRLIDAGYYVVSIDQRGFGQSGGTVRAMDPEYDGPSLVAVLDWAENLPGLRRRADGSMVVGSYGGSYGGMFQYLLAAYDPQQRLRVIAPDISPHDLSYALNSGGVFKAGWGLGLIAQGELPLLSAVTGSDGPGAVTTALTQILQRVAAGEPIRQDSTLYEIVVGTALGNRMSETGRNFFRYHGARHFCDGDMAGPQAFSLPTSIPDALSVPPRPFPRVDALISQGMPDTLFNLNEAARNYECLKRGGGDVRLFTHQSGHVLPVSTSGLPLLDAFETLVNIPEFQGAGGATSCGGVSLEDANFAWFEEKLNGKRGAADRVIRSGRDVCMSIADDDAVRLREIKRGGPAFELAGEVPQLNSLLGVVGSLLGTALSERLQAIQPLYTAPAGGTLAAGIPTLSARVSALNPSLEITPCPTPLVAGACDPIYFLGIGHRAHGETNWRLVDGQITPLRGFGEHVVDMNGISVRLAEGDQLALLIYAFHLQYPITWSRDLLVPAARISGTLQLPLLSAGEILGEGL